MKILINNKIEKLKDYLTLVAIVLILSSFKSDVSDIDGNIYKTVIVGHQEWMVENLKVSRFRNGDIIPRAIDEFEWIKAGEEGKPAWCYYDDNFENGKKYGKLYNWYAVKDPRGLAPKGFHIPSDDEWTFLKTYLEENGYSKKEAIVLKSTIGWNENFNSDKFGWNGFSSGCRNSSNLYRGLGSGGFWWSSTEHMIFSAWYRSLTNDSMDLNRAATDKKNGFSVRCIRD